MYNLVNTLVSLALICSVQTLQMDDCLEITEPTLCYLCDSQEDAFCGDPFHYSHYHSSKDIYLTECQGCCVKIVHPSYKGSERQILRSCTDNLPRLNYTLEESCNSDKDEDRKICICEKELCNRSTILHGSSFLTALLVLFYYISGII